MPSRLLLAVLIATSALLTSCWNPPKIDDVGGVRLVYAVDDQAMAHENEPIDLSMVADQLQSTIAWRLSSTGLKGVEVVPLGNSTVEVSIAEAKQGDLVQIKELLSMWGNLAFRIVANATDDQQLIALARKTNDDVVKNPDGEIIGRWTNLRVSPTGELPVDLDDVLRAKNIDGEFVAIFSEDQRRRMTDRVFSITQYLAVEELSDPQVLLLVDPNRNRDVTGRFLRSASATFDGDGRPAIRFYMNEEGAKRLAAFSGKNLPDASTGVHRRIAIVLDEEVVYAPHLTDRISDSGIITGDFTSEEVDTIVQVLNSGRLPVPLKPVPISETWVSPR